MDIEQNILEQKMVDDAFQHLLDTYLTTRHRKKVEIITKAFNFARQAHEGVRRLSGEPYIMHPLAVAQIVCEEIGLGSTSICCALLHDVVEDTEYTVEDIQNIFGDKIAQIVDGLTKIAGGVFGEHASVQAENFKKLLLTMNEDIRVILIKIADRLHNMRTLGSQAENKRYKIAGETEYLYAPLAHRLGLNRIKSELENLSFQYEHPDEYASIVHKIQDTEEDRNTTFEEFIAPIRKAIDKLGIKYTIKARVKTPFSVWKKMQTKHVPFEEVYDLLAVRIVFEPHSEENENRECFDIYLALTSIYNEHQGRMRNWLAHPKPNGYQALHCTLMSNNGDYIEVQIRSERMDAIAEKGIAAHWRYKQEQQNEDVDNKVAEQSMKDMYLDKWLVDVKEILEDPQPNSIDKLSKIQLSLCASDVFVFTPKGDMKIFPSGSTALDFAFSIHTNVGTHCIGVKVNHKLEPLSYVLKSGDQIEVLTSRENKVKHEWMEIAMTPKARTKIATALRHVEKELQKEGETKLMQFFERHELVWDSLSLERIVRFHGFTRVEQLFLALGQDVISLSNDDIDIVKYKSRHWLRNLLRFGKVSNEHNDKLDKSEMININKKVKFQITDESIGTTCMLEKCCNPISGDKVMGYVDANNLVHIHRLDCDEAQKIKASYGNNIVAANWTTSVNTVFNATLLLEGIDKLGVVSEITDVISKEMNVNMRRLEIESKEGLMIGRLELYFHNTTEIHSLIKNLKKVTNIKKIARL